MLHRVRAQARAIASTVLVAMAALALSAAAPHQNDCHDAACAVAIWHDPAAHSIRAAAPADDQTHAVHCIVCHWHRSVRPRTEAAQHLARPVDVAVRTPIAAFKAAGVFPAAQPPLRSPPASPHRLFQHI